MEHPIPFVFAQKTDIFRFTANGMQTVHRWRSTCSQSYPHIRAIGLQTVCKSFGSHVCCVPALTCARVHTFSVPQCYHLWRTAEIFIITFSISLCLAVIFFSRSGEWLKTTPKGKARLFTTLLGALDWGLERRWYPCHNFLSIFAVIILK